MSPRAPRWHYYSGTRSWLGAACHSVAPGKKMQRSLSVTSREDGKNGLGLPLLPSSSESHCSALLLLPLPWRDVASHLVLLSRQTTCQLVIN